MGATVLSLMVLTIIVLLAGAVFFWIRLHKPKRALLMLLLAAVIAVNIALWTAPVLTGGTLSSDALAGPPATDSP